MIFSPTKFPTSLTFIWYSRAGRSAGCGHISYGLIRIHVTSCLSIFFCGVGLHRKQLWPAGRGIRNCWPNLQTHFLFSHPYGPLDFFYSDSQRNFTSEKSIYRIWMGGGCFFTRVLHSLSRFLPQMPNFDKRKQVKKPADGPLNRLHM